MHTNIKEEKVALSFEYTLQADVMCVTTYLLPPSLIPYTVYFICPTFYSESNCSPLFFPGLIIFLRILAPLPHPNTYTIAALSFEYLSLLYIVVAVLAFLSPISAIPASGHPCPHPSFGAFESHSVWLYSPLHLCVVQSYIVPQFPLNIHFRFHGLPSSLH